MSRPKVAVAATGVANLASVLAALGRAGADCSPTTDADALADADFAVLPGVGAFGEAASALRGRGLDRALLERWKRGAPTLGVCLGMQLFFEGSEESPGVAGLAILPGTIRRFASGLPLPQLGWNRVEAAPGLRADRGILREGWAYFANTYRLDSQPDACGAWFSDYGERFVAAVEAGEARGGGPSLLLCQFHPELSGRWGLGLLKRWLGAVEGSEA